MRASVLTSMLTIKVLFSFYITMSAGVCLAQDSGLHGLNGQWLFVEDRTAGRAVKDQGPPMSIKFALRVEKDAVIYPRPRGDERITLDGTAIKKENSNGSVTHYRGKWKDGVLDYTLETTRQADNQRVLKIQRKFQLTADGLLVRVSLNDGKEQVAIYRHPDDIALPKPTQARASDLAWLSDVWSGKQRTSTTEERWLTPKGGAMIGVSRTFKQDKMVAFEYLRIIERDGSLVYIAQPGGRPPTEFVLVQLEKNRAVFVNPRHDYPQRIVYQLSPDGVLTASIGFAKGRLQSFEYKRTTK